MSFALQKLAAPPTQNMLGESRPSPGNKFPNSPLFSFLSQTILHSSVAHLVADYLISDYRWIMVPRGQVSEENQQLIDLITDLCGPMLVKSIASHSCIEAAVLHNLEIVYFKGDSLSWEWQGCAPGSHEIFGSQKNPSTWNLYFPESEQAKFEGRLNDLTMPGRILYNNCNQGMIRYNNAHRYTGDLNEGHPHGHGVMFYTAENVQRISRDKVQISDNYYIGAWQDGKENGYGIKRAFSHDPTARTYEGHWRNGQRHGEGTLTCFNQKREGIWENDQLR